MKMNYNEWFDKQYKYQTGNRNGKVTYNDTKFTDINKRYKTLVDMESELLNEQPFGVVGNNYGFDKLINLMGKSNYSFDDINESLIETYKHSLKNAMGSMLVNTQAVMFSTSNVNKSNVVSDKFTHYYIIDAPFNQMHFGDRDEFIRQKLHLMHSVDADYYVPMDTFITSEIADILGFTIICTINGYICNDCKVAVSDKGFKFKVGWPYSSDVKFVIYKLDESFISKNVISAKYITDFKSIPYSALKINKEADLLNKRCLVNIYDSNFVKTVPSVVNFGTFTETGFVISNVQQKTLTNISMNKSTNITLVIYVLDYLHEVPNVYPACNYYDITDSRKVYTEDGNKVDTIDGKTVYASSSMNVNLLEKCTPPISLDRSVNMSFNTICDCLDLYDKLIGHIEEMRAIGSALIDSMNLTQSQFVDKVIRPINAIYNDIYDCYKTYLKGAVLTSLVSTTLIDKFKTFVESLNNIRNSKNALEASKYLIDDLFGDNYISFVDVVSSPFSSDVLSNFKNLSHISKNYFTDDNHTRFNRPVSEQCFITLKYNRIDECWLFDYPQIKHFKGIGNTFYIDDKSLYGNEVYKFFVLYTDTMAPSVTDDNVVPPLTLDQILDFNKFENEVNRHLGFIKYWNIENKLMKICKIMYDKYDDDTCVQVLAHILKGKIDGDDILSVYPSDIEYELSAITSDNVANMTDESERGPFSINFLFYTLNMMMNNEDKLQTYFVNNVMMKKYNKRYIDIDIIGSITPQLSYPINYSQFTIAPNSIEPGQSVIPDEGRHAYYGLPFMVNNTYNIDTVNPYRYTYNICESKMNHYMISYNDITKSKYLIYANTSLSENGYQICKYHDDIYACKLYMLYLSAVYDYIAALQTNYMKTFNQSTTIDTCIKTIDIHAVTISKYLDTNPSFMHADSRTIGESIVNDNPVISYMNDMHRMINDINAISYNNKVISIFDFFNNILSTLRNVYVTSGFDLYADKRVRKFYIYLKEINFVKSIYAYRKWLNNFDYELLTILDNLLAANENYTSGNNVFKTFASVYLSYANSVIPIIDSYYNAMNNLSEAFKTTHIDPITTYCDDIIKNYIFDLYAIDDIKFNVDDSMVSDKPCTVSMTCSIDNHFYPPLAQIPTDENVTLLFQTISDINSNSYYIKSLSKICEYTIFSGDDISCKMNIMDTNGNVMKSIDSIITFKKIGSTADITSTFNQIANANTTVIDIENIHEDITIDSDNNIVSSPANNMNYELLLGNQFDQLDYVHEMILNPKTMNPGPVDRIIIENQKLNNLINNEFGVHASKRVFFKPCQVMHIEINDNTLESVGGKYFVGQTLYAHTDDNKYVFPIIVTAIDHSMSRGFIEAMIDYRHAKWFTTEDQETITKYLTSSQIRCHVLPDNICNFIDEYSNKDYDNYSSAMINDYASYSDDNFSNAWSLPGDPLFVQTNAPFIYNRINWMFDKLVPNRFIDEETKKHKFIYVGTGHIIDENDSIRLKMINHDFNKFTDSELYPILRQEPNDHAIWDLEISTFNQYKKESELKEREYLDQIKILTDNIRAYDTEFDQEILMTNIDSLKLKVNKEIEFRKKMDNNIKQLEQPTTWFNVRSYETAMIYISNGRADNSNKLIVSTNDLSYSDKMNVFIYDWEHKCWLNPDTYEIESTILDAYKVDEYDDYKTTNVLHSITIKPLDDFVYSNQLLVYFSYDKSDIFDNIELNDNSFDVRFKPVLSLDNINIGDSNDGFPYDTIRVRKHLDCTEKYLFKDYNKPDDFSITNSFYINRPKRNGKNTYTPELRLCDLTVVNDDIEYGYDKFDMYIRMPFKDVSIDGTFNVPTYTCKIHTPIDSFIPNQKIKLICIQNNDVSSYNGNFSNVMFEGITSYETIDGNQIQSITITNSSLNNNIDGEFICSINKSNEYRMFGSIVTITISFDKVKLIDEMNNWVKVPSSLSTHREIPSECVFVPHDDVNLNMTTNVMFNLSNKYNKTSDDVIAYDNSNPYNLFEYYFDDVNKRRLPISNIRKNEYDKRLVIDQTSNPNIKLVKSTYIGICRYSLQHIPRNGFIDLTGYVPTPLTRERYEFWVNGRFIDNDKDLIILSPTSIQLCNLKSLRNFELIELVDDVNTSDIINNKNVYVDLNGKSYSSFNRAVLSNRNIIDQEIRFSYNIEQHQSIHDYSNNIIENPNNHDLENDIFDYIIELNEEETSDYNELYNVPTLNGIPLRHMSTSSIGIIDIPNDDIIKLLDEVWVNEEIGNPIFPMTHRDNNYQTDKYLRLKINESSNEHGCYSIYTTGTVKHYFTLYVSTKSDGNIDDVDNTKLIIPFIKVGTCITVSKDYAGMWLHSTEDNCKPIQLR